MKVIKILFPILSLLILFSCKPEEELVVDKYNVDIGEFNLLPESSAAMPYFGGKSILFVDSIGNEAEAIVNESLFGTGMNSGFLLRYDVYEEGDTVKYSYVEENRSFFLEAASLDINMNISLRARPYYSDPESKAVADVINIFCNYPEPVTDSINNLVLSSSQVFFHIVDQRTWPTPLSTQRYDAELVVLGRTFKDVYQNEIAGPKSKILYNYEFGIISFTDHTGKTWRFEKWIE